jgi:hypothetical protein
MLSGGVGHNVGNGGAGSAWRQVLYLWLVMESAVVAAVISAELLGCVVGAACCGWVWVRRRQLAES